MPIKVKRDGDALKSCKGIAWELGEIEKDINEIISVSEKSQNQNLTTFFLAGPLSVDPGSSQKQEIREFKMRFNHLLNLGNEKKCLIEKKAFLEINSTSNTEKGNEY
jgi:hypothetical protein